MRIASKGQVTTSRAMRERAGLRPGTDVVFEFPDGRLRLVKAGPGATREMRGQELVARLRGAGDFGMTTDELLALMREPPAEV